MQSVCVYCGSSHGADPAFADAARAVGLLIAESGRTLVYGGGHVGLMGVVADSALAAGGRVVGVIPRTLMEREVGHGALTELHVVESMHERKALMADLSDGFLALPGGVGTMEEFFETWTWAVLGLHGKPFGLLDVAGFYAALLAFLDRLLEQGFLREHHRAMLLVGRDPGALIDAMDAYQAPEVPRWIGRDET
ncbi:LOG family protein [Tautonia sociabilis]|uniref:LOG family protein n=1 Tax=Tautonia sociabilis TaxID=2080755 RepID=UPI001F25E53D|nr:TIGR00730 family Rossman fold protein [Tautonia sociabilis]